MHIGVLGAGVIGSSTAYALARQGHQVTVIEKNSQVASEASHANGAQLSYSYVDPFAGPATLKSLPRYLLGLDHGAQLNFSLSPAYLSWGLRFLGQCSTNKQTANLRSRSILSLESMQTFAKFQDEVPGLKLNKTGTGKLVLIDNDQNLTSLERAAETYTQLGLEREILRRKECEDLEPALADYSSEFAGAIYSPSDFALDPVIYCKALKTACEASGVSFQFETEVHTISQKNGKLDRLSTSKGEMHFDSIVVCLGNHSKSVMQELGINLPIFGFQGYSLTLPDTESSPKVSITALSDKIVFAKLKNSVRIAGFLDANQSNKKTDKRINQLATLAQRLWPSIADFENPIKTWTHYRPMTPSGVPIIGETKVKNLFVNAGHGSLGYTFAAGSAQRIADAIGYPLNNYKQVTGI